MLIISMLMVGSFMTTMQFGGQFFPDVRPEEKSAADYFRDSLDLVEAAEPLA